MTTEEKDQKMTKVVCPGCRKDFVPIASGKIKVHRIKGVECEGVGEDPYTGEEGSPSGSQCRVCKGPVVLEPSGRTKPHLTREQVPQPCDGGSDWPLGVYPDIEGSTRGPARSDVATAGDESWRPGSGWQLADHDHTYEWGDDNNGHSGSFCTTCGKEEPQDPPDRPLISGGSMGDMEDDRFPSGGHTMVGSGTVKARPVDAANDFLSGTRKALTPPGAADDFLSGSAEDDGDDDESSGPGSWFEARYDGDCGTCGTHFEAGDRIRADGSGDWEAEDCCGDEIETPAEKAAEKARQPVTADPSLPVRNGRYVAPHPKTGKQAKFTRTTTFAEAVSDSIALDQWKGRMEAMGLALNPDLIAKVRSAVQGRVPYEVAKEQREFLNGVVEQAKLAAGSKDRARKGTILHKHTQEIDSGRRTLAEVPEEFRPDVAAYLTAMEGAGLRLLPQLIERSVVTTELDVVGTFDRIVEVLWDQEAQDLSGRPVRLRKGDHVIGDVKSGASLLFAWPEIEIQLAIYAHAVNENGVAVPDGPRGQTTWRWAPLAEFGVPAVRQDVGIVMHMPYGEKTCELHLADLVEGWRGAQLCKVVREWRRIKFPDAPFFRHVELVKEAPREDRPTGFDVTPTGESWEERFRAVQTKEEGSALWREAKAAGMPPDELKRLTGLVRLPAVVHAAAGDHADSEPLPSPELSEALHHKREADSALDQQERYGGSGGTSRAEDPWPTWESRFRAVQTKEEGSALWREAKAAGVVPVELKRLTGLVKLSPPTLEERAAAVTTRAEASALFQEMRDNVETIGKPRIAGLVKIMQEALPA